MSKVHQFAVGNLTPKGFTVYSYFTDLLPEIWRRPSSSSGKYHLNSSGIPDSLEDHVISMLNTAKVLFRMFPEIDRNPNIQDILILGIIFHDALKYGPDGLYSHTVSNHDYSMEEFLTFHRKEVLNYYSPDEFILLRFIIKYHSGRWGGKKLDKANFKWDEYPIFCYFIHILDMLSSNHLIKDELYKTVKGD